MNPELPVPPPRFLPASWDDVRAVDVQRELEAIGFKFASDHRGNLVVVPIEQRSA